VTYGSFAAAIILLVWLWLTNVSLLFGAEVNAEIAREKRRRGGGPAPHAPRRAPGARAGPEPSLAARRRAR